MSNLERQRRFRERNPGYYGRLHAKRRARVQALLEAKRQAAQAALAQAGAADAPRAGGDDSRAVARAATRRATPDSTAKR